MNSFAKSTDLLDWLLDGDSSVRYQALRDLCDADQDIIKKEQQKVETTGWGARLLGLQDMAGTWGGGLYSPKWTSTFYTLLLLQNLGMLPNKKVMKACQIILERGFYTDHGINLWASMKHSEVCVTGMFLSILSQFCPGDKHLPLLAGYLLGKQMQDGGWNCQIYKGDTHASFHTTLCVLEGLLAYERLGTNKYISESRQARTAGMEFLLQHKLFRSHHTGKIVDPNMTRFHFPCHWKYDVMRALDYAQHAGHKPDRRFRDGIQLIRSKQLPDGRWKLVSRYPGKIFFELEPAGQPSRWITLRALRILNWFESSRGNA